MAGMRGRINLNDLRKFQKSLLKMTKSELQQWNEAAVKELAARLLAKAGKRTPVYKKIPNDANAHTGGTLRRGWTIGEVKKVGNEYTIEVFNPVHYAEYVEFGHRGVYVPELGKVMHKNTHWTEGQFMLTMSEQELQLEAPKIMMNKLKTFMGGYFG